MTHPRRRSELMVTRGLEQAQRRRPASAHRAIEIREKRRRALLSNAARPPGGYDGAAGAADPMMSASRFAKALIASAKLFSSAVGNCVTA